MLEPYCGLGTLPVVAGGVGDVDPPPEFDEPEPELGLLEAVLPPSPPPPHADNASSETTATTPKHA